MRWNGDPEWSLLESAAGSFVIGKDQHKVTELVKELRGSEEVGGSRPGEKGETPKCLGPVCSGGGEELVQLSGGHGRGLPLGVPSLEKEPCLEDSVDERVLERERESTEMSLENDVSEISLETLRSKTTTCVSGPDSDLKWEW